MELNGESWCGARGWLAAGLWHGRRGALLEVVMHAHLIGASSLPWLLCSRKIAERCYFGTATYWQSQGDKLACPCSPTGMHRLPAQVQD